MSDVSIGNFSHLKFNQENLKAWIDALRSGEYQQTVGKMNDSDGYCCLGVLCEVSKLVRFESSIYSVYSTPVLVDNKEIPLSKAEPPYQVMNWLIENYVANRPDVSFMSKLIQMNDGERLDFNQIADYLEQFLDKEVSYA